MYYYKQAQGAPNSASIGRIQVPTSDLAPPAPPRFGRYSGVEPPLGPTEMLAACRPKISSSVMGRRRRVGIGGLDLRSH